MIYFKPKKKKNHSINNYNNEGVHLNGKLKKYYCNYKININ